jgi:ParB-like chromosome segregation protein Spo0J
MEQYVMLPIDAVVIGERVRDDYGEIERLSASLRKWGQLLPIIVDQDYRLCDGGRRMRAAIAAGLTEIAASVRTMTEEERRDLELEIDREHKPLTDLERSKRYIAKAREAAAALEATATPEKSAAVAENKKRAGGQAKKLVTKKDAAEAVGLTISQLEKAEQHVKAVDEFPDLASLPQDTALKEARKERMKAAPDAAEKQLEKDAKVDAARRRTAFSRGIEHLDKLVRLKPELLADALTTGHWDRFDEMETLTRQWFAEMNRARSRGLHLVG